MENSTIQHKIIRYKNIMKYNVIQNNTKLQ